MGLRTVPAGTGCPTVLGGIGHVHRRSGPWPEGRKEREGVSHCCHPLEGVWLLGKQCFEKLLRWGRSPPPPKFPPRLPPSVSLPLLELCLMNWRFFFFFLLGNCVLCKMHVQ